MTKTISQKLRELALSERGGHHIAWVHRPHAYYLRLFIGDGEFHITLQPDERRMFALFVACALESEQ